MHHDETPIEPPTILISAPHLRSAAASILCQAGLSEGDAGTVAAALTSADLRGTSSHGVIRLPFLVRRLLDGGANPTGLPYRVSDAPAAAVLDGDRTLGPVATAAAMHLAIEKARTQGAGVVAVRNSDFFGTCAHPAMMALAHDMIGIVWTNGFPGMAPWGGRRNDIGNNPIGIAVPRSSGAPIVLDMAMSVAAGGRIRLAGERGERVPEGWLVDRDGLSTCDPAALMAGGALLSLGYKGFGLAVMGEILAGLLPGARMLSEIPAWFKATAEPVGSGHLSVALNIESFVEPAAFKARVDEMVERLKATPLIPGVAEILMPGERAAATEACQRREGIRLLASVAASLKASAIEVGLDAGALPAELR